MDPYFPRTIAYLEAHLHEKPEYPAILERVKRQYANYLANMHNPQKDYTLPENKPTLLDKILDLPDTIAEALITRKESKKKIVKHYHYR